MGLRAAIAPGLVLGMLGLLACGPKQDPQHLERQLELEVMALQAVNRDLRHQAATCSDAGPPDAIYADLHQVFAGTEIAVEREGPITVVTLPVSILFTDPYSLRFREEATMTLDLLATALNLHPDHRIELEGHSDDRILPGDLVRRYGSHLDLSFQYAAAVMQHLTQDFDVPDSRFVVSARGGWAPVASNDLPTGQARNRRVEVRIRPGNAETPRP